MKRALLLAALGLCACPVTKLPAPTGVSSFRIVVTGVFEETGATRRPLSVVTTCANRFGGQAMVPAIDKGTPNCRYVISPGVVQFDLTADALDINGKELTDFAGPVALKALPGDPVGGYDRRVMTMVAGKGTGTISARHQYGEVKLWVEDAPPPPLFDGGVLVTEGLPVEPAKRSFAASASSTIYFADHTFQSLQLPEGFDNRSSSFVGEFVVVGKNPGESNVGQLRQSCPDDPENDGKESTMVITGIEPTGFFVTDLTACRLPEQTKDSTGATQVRTPEPPELCVVARDGGFVETLDGGMGTCAISKKACTKTSACTSYLPGTYAHMFIFNFSYPEGLNTGDRLYTLGGAVQEFTSTTQMTFPSWSVAEHVRLLPPEQWNKWLGQVPITEITARTCGMDNTFAPFLTDQLCGHNKRNLKMESLESGLVKLRRVRMPNLFKNCDFNSNGSVPFFCESKPADWVWASCDFMNAEAEADRVERQCNVDCTIGAGEFAGSICSEESNFLGFGQYVVELNPPGLGSLGLDDSLPARTLTVRTSAVSAPTQALPTSSTIVVACDQPTFVKVGPVTPVATSADRRLAAREVAYLTLGAMDEMAAFLSAGTPGSCSVSIHTKARIQLITKDAIPELNPDCRTDDANADKALQCRQLRAATFDIIGHARHVQPARPRWAVIPRDVDDVCCYPGPGMECPKPIKPCQ